MPVLRRLTITLLFTALSLTACSGNNFVISTAYNRLDNSSSKRFYKYAKFDKQQRQQIKATINQFHLWHRKQQLPLYVDLLSSMETSLRSGDPLDSIKINSWLSDIYSFRDNAEGCSPMLQSAVFLRELSDSQVEDIQERFDELSKDSEKRRNKYTSEERQQRRLKSMIKNLKFMGLKLNDTQIEMLANTQSQTEPTRELWSKPWSQWKSDFIQLLATRSDANFEVNLKKLVSDLSKIPENHYPEVLARNQDRWSKLALDIGSSLDTKQQQEFLTVLTKVIYSLNELAIANPETDTSFAFPAEAACLAS